MYPRARRITLRDILHCCCCYSVLIIIFTGCLKEHYVRCAGQDLHVNGDMRASGGSELADQSRTSFDPESYRSLFEGRSLVLSVEQYGLANRLRALSDWYLIAEMSHRRLLVSWTVSSIPC
jgi:hypothetical protein